VYVDAGNRFLRVVNCTIETGDVNKRPFFGHQYGKPDIYKTYFTQQYEARNNTYISPDSSAGFDRFQGEYSALDLITLEQWQAFTGQEQGSKWVQRRD
jgi:hypothetical protein